jgi:hypothetical protein
MVEIEGEIKALESRQAEHSRILQNPPEDSTLIWQTGEDFVALQQKIDGLMREWAEIEDTLRE